MRQVVWISEETCFDCVMSVCCSATHFSHQVKAIARAITLHSCQIKQPLCPKPALRVLPFLTVQGTLGFLLLRFSFKILFVLSQKKIRASGYLMPLCGPKDFSQVGLLKLEPVPHVCLLKKMINNSHLSTLPCQVEGYEWRNTLCRSTFYLFLSSLFFIFLIQMQSLWNCTFFQRQCLDTSLTALPEPASELSSKQPNRKLLSCPVPWTSQLQGGRHEGFQSQIQLFRKPQMSEMWTVSSAYTCTVSFSTNIMTC